MTNVGVVQKSKYYI